MMFGKLGATFLGNLLTDKEVRTKIPGQRVTRESERTIRAGQNF